VPPRPVKPRYCIRAGCGARLERRISEPPSMFNKRWFCSRWCTAVVREQLKRRPPSYGGETYTAAVRRLIKTHPLEFYCLYQSVALADATQNDRVDPQQLSLIELNGTEQ